MVIVSFIEMLETEKRTYSPTIMRVLRRTNNFIEVEAKGMETGEVDEKCDYMCMCS